MDPEQVTHCPTCGAVTQPCCDTRTCGWLKCAGRARHRIRAKDLHVSGTNYRPTAMDLVWCHDCKDAFGPDHQCDSEDIRP